MSHCLLHIVHFGKNGLHGLNFNFLLLLMSCKIINIQWEAPPPTHKARMTLRMYGPSVLFCPVLSAKVRQLLRQTAVLHQVMGKARGGGRGIPPTLKFKPYCHNKQNYCFLQGLIVDCLLEWFKVSQHEFQLQTSGTKQPTHHFPIHPGEL